MEPDERPILPPLKPRELPRELVRLTKEVDGRPTELPRLLPSDVIPRLPDELDGRVIFPPVELRFVVT